MAQIRRVFISYSHVDERFRIELEKHLSPLFLMKRVATWTDRELRAGQALYEKIKDSVKSAEIVLLLVSSDYLYSQSCIEEMEVALSRSRDGSAAAIPIIVRYCDWQILPLGKILAIPKDGNPVSAWPDPDRAWTDVVREIRLLIEDWEATTVSYQPEDVQPAETAKVTPSEAEAETLSEVGPAPNRTERWVFRKEANDGAWDETKSELLSRLLAISEVDNETHITLDGRRWGSKLLIDMKHPGLASLRRIWIEDVGGGPGYPGYQLRVAADERLNLQIERLRWVEMTDGSRLLMDLNRGTKEAFTAEGYADHFWHLLKKCSFCAH